MEPVIIIGGLGKVHISPLTNGKKRLKVELYDKTAYIQTPKWETAYSLDLIKMIMEVKTEVWLCDEIIREESTGAVQNKIRNNLLGVLNAQAFTGKRILDFGCGCGASTMNLAKLFPTAEIVGVELDHKSLAVARARAEFYGYKSVTFYPSPSENSLPPGLGVFDYINLNAVYEHLLPAERRAILTKLWAILVPAGVLFISETPYRYSLFEVHTTGLPLVNFLPDRLAAAASRWFSKRIGKREEWRKMLRNGFRGGRASEILKIIKATSGGATLIPSALPQLKNGLETWGISPSEAEACLRNPWNPSLNRILWTVLRGLNRYLKIPYAADLSLAIKKSQTPPAERVA